MRLRLELFRGHLFSLENYIDNGEDVQPKSGMKKPEKKKGATKRPPSRPAVQRVFAS